MIILILPTALDRPYCMAENTVDRALRLGHPSRYGDHRDHRRARFKFEKLKFTWIFCLDRKTTKRQATKRRNLLETVNSLTGPSFRNGSGP